MRVARGSAAKVYIAKIKSCANVSTANSIMITLQAAMAALSTLLCEILLCQSKLLNVYF